LTSKFNTSRHLLQQGFFKSVEGSRLEDSISLQIATSRRLRSLSVLVGLWHENPSKQVSMSTQKTGHFPKIGLPRQKLHGGGFSSPVPVICSICIICWKLKVTLRLDVPL